MKINPIGTKYNNNDYVTIDNGEIVNPVGITITDNNGWEAYYEECEQFMGGKIIDIFVHPESDCVWFIVEYCGTYFEVIFDDIFMYGMEFEPLPFR